MPVQITSGGAVKIDPVTHKVQLAGIGACCAADGTCSILSESECVAAGGTYQGNGTSCSPNPCYPNVSIKLSYNAGRSLLDCRVADCGDGLCWLTDGGGFDHSVCWDVVGGTLDDTITLPDNVLKCFPTGGDAEIVPMDVELIYSNTGSNISLTWILTAHANSCCAFTSTLGPTIYSAIDQEFTFNTGFTGAVNMQVDISFSGSLC